jgi:hypothetical protein
MTTVRTLADPLFNSIINKGELTMNNEIICETTEEHNHAEPSTTLITSSQPVVGEIPTNTNAPVQGVSGAVYAPMDTSPQASRLDQLAMQLQETIKQIVLEVNNTKAQPELADTVEQVLTQANWFYDMVKETIEDNHDIESLVDDRVDDRVGSAVDEWFSYTFELTDHCDIHDIVGDVLDDKLESIVEEKLEELLAEKLQNARITVNF